MPIQFSVTVSHYIYISPKNFEKTCAGQPLPAFPIFGPRASTTLVARAQGGPRRGETRQDRRKGNPRRYHGFVRARARSEGLWARAWAGPNFSRGFQTHTGSSLEVDGALCGRCTDIHRCRSPEKTCPEGLTRAWVNLLYPKKTGKVCHGRSLGEPWTSAEVLWRFRSPLCSSGRSG